MRLNELSDNQGARKARVRVGRGRGSGKGKTGGRGLNGQKSRSGVSLVGFEGGQMPLYRRIPKRGFNNISRKKFEIVNLEKLEVAVQNNKLDSNKIIDSQAMKNAGLISGKKDGIRLLGTGKLSAKLNIEVTGASKSAILAVEEAGGKITLSGPTKALLDAREKSVKLQEKKAKRKGSGGNVGSDPIVENENRSSEEGN